MRCDLGDACRVTTNGETLSIASDFSAARIVCIRAVESARRCVKDMCSAPGLDECRSSCEDTATILEALIEMLERAWEPPRVPSLRRMIDAGLASALDCATECRFAESLPACTRCAAACEQASAALAQLRSSIVSRIVVPSS